MSGEKCPGRNVRGEMSGGKCPEGNVRETVARLNVSSGEISGRAINENVFQPYCIAEPKIPHHGGCDCSIRQRSVSRAQW